MRGGFSPGGALILVCQNGGGAFAGGGVDGGALVRHSSTCIYRVAVVEKLAALSEIIVTVSDTHVPLVEIKVFSL